jgi:hypothetical protein
MRRVLSVSLFLLSLAAFATLKPQAAFAKSPRANTCAKIFHDCYFAASNSAGRARCQEAFIACVQTCPVGEDAGQAN